MVLKLLQAFIIMQRISGLDKKDKHWKIKALDIMIPWYIVKQCVSFFTGDAFKRKSWWSFKTPKFPTERIFLYKCSSEIRTMNVAMGKRTPPGTTCSNETHKPIHQMLQVKSLYINILKPCIWHLKCWVLAVMYTTAHIEKSVKIWWIMSKYSTKV